MKILEQMEPKLFWSMSQPDVLSRLFTSNYEYSYPSQPLSFVPDHRDYHRLLWWVARCRARQLPGNVPFEVQRELIVAFQRSWHSAALNCFTVIKDLTLKVLYEYADARFGRWSRLRLSP